MCNKTVVPGYVLSPRVTRLPVRQERIKAYPEENRTTAARNAVCGPDWKWLFRPDTGLTDRLAHIMPPPEPPAPLLVAGKMRSCWQVMDVDPDFTRGAGTAKMEVVRPQAHPIYVRSYRSPLIYCSITYEYIRDCEAVQASRGRPAVRARLAARRPHGGLGLERQRGEKCPQRRQRRLEARYPSLPLLETLPPKSPDELGLWFKDETIGSPCQPATPTCSTPITGAECINIDFLSRGWCWGGMQLVLLMYVVPPAGLTHTPLRASQGKVRTECAVSLHLSLAAVLEARAKTSSLKLQLVKVNTTAYTSRVRTGDE
ncbi:hypothetical protein Bbelb_264560 [Branchiostoma belcheri]|nr:hypothetical protein Bbelb_264560 [Branchiostoma belcheri]